MPDNDRGGAFVFGQAAQVGLAEGVIDLRGRASVFSEVELVRRINELKKRTA